MGLLQNLYIGISRKTHATLFAFRGTSFKLTPLLSEEFNHKGLSNVNMEVSDRFADILMSMFLIYLASALASVFLGYWLSRKSDAAHKAARKVQENRDKPRFVEFEARARSIADELLNSNWEVTQVKDGFASTDQAKVSILYNEYERRLLDLEREMDFRHPKSYCFREGFSSKAHDKFVWSRLTSEERETAIQESKEQVKQIETAFAEHDLKQKHLQRIATIKALPSAILLLVAFPLVISSGVYVAVRIITIFMGDPGWAYDAAFFAFLLGTICGVTYFFSRLQDAEREDRPWRDVLRTAMRTFNKR